MSPDVQGGGLEYCAHPCVHKYKCAIVCKSTFLCSAVGLFPARASLPPTRITALHPPNLASHIPSAHHPSPRSRACVCTCHRGHQRAQPRVYHAHHIACSVTHVACRDCTQYGRRLHLLCASRPPSPSTATTAAPSHSSHPQAPSLLVPQQPGLSAIHAWLV